MKAEFRSPSGTLVERLTGEVPSRRMLFEVIVLALLLHIWILMRLLEASEPVKVAQPLMIEVSMMTAPSQRSEAPQTPKPPEPPKPKPKKLKKKKPKAPKIPKQETIPVPEAKAVEAEAEHAPQPPPAAVASSAKKSSDSASLPFTEANFRANYGFNPKPVYPRLARSRGWQGKVLLRVQVSAEGHSDRVTVFHGSGHDVLDESAVAAVEKWKFIPAMRGTTPVASSVIVPIIFTLNN